LGDKHHITRDAVASVLYCARQKGIYVRPDDRIRKIKMGMTKKWAKVPHSKKTEARRVKRLQSAKETLERKQGLYRVRSMHSLGWWRDKLPAEHDQCRWLEGDLVEGTLLACKTKREDAHLPLEGDPMPYCTEHKDRARKKGNEAKDAAETVAHCREFVLRQMTYA
jgi:hypothetical protein